jgi:hypothetical protein
MYILDKDPTIITWYMPGSFRRFWDWSRYIGIVSDRLKPAYSCLSLHVHYTQWNYSVVIMLVNLIDRRGWMWSFASDWESWYQKYCRCFRYLWWTAYCLAQGVVSGINRFKKSCEFSEDDERNRQNKDVLIYETAQLKYQRIRVTKYGVLLYGNIPAHQPLIVQQPT